MLLLVGVRILRAEEQTPLTMQHSTAYVVEVSDFGQVSEVSHHGDFEALHVPLLTGRPSLNWAVMPPEGIDSMDTAAVASREVEFERLLKAMLNGPEVLMEKAPSFWKFLNRPNPAVLCGRFVAMPRFRSSTLKTLAKLTDPKYLHKASMAELVGGSAAVPGRLDHGILEFCELSLVCMALQCIVSVKVPHRDLKTSSIFLMGGDSETRLRAFGISWVLEGTTEADGTTVGTPNYVSPGSSATGPTL